MTITIAVLKIFPVSVFVTNDKMFLLKNGKMFLFIYKSLICLRASFFDKIVNIKQKIVSVLIGVNFDASANVLI